MVLYIKLDYITKFCHCSLSPFKEKILTEKLIIFMHIKVVK